MLRNLRGACTIEGSESVGFCIGCAVQSGVFATGDSSQTTNKGWIEKPVCVLIHSCSIRTLQKQTPSWHLLVDALLLVLRVESFVHVLAVRAHTCDHTAEQCRHIFPVLQT